MYKLHQPGFKDSKGNNWLSIHQGIGVLRSNHLHSWPIYAYIH